MEVFETLRRMGFRKYKARPNPQSNAEKVHLKHGETETRETMLCCYEISWVNTRWNMSININTEDRLELVNSLSPPYV